MSVLGTQLLLGRRSGYYQIDRSLRFNDDDSAYLNRTPGGAGNRKTWTWNGWVKRGNLSSYQQIWGAYIGSGVTDSNYTEVAFTSGDLIQITGYSTVYLRTTQVFRDPSAWYMLTVVFDTTSATANNRIRLYVNGVEVTSFGTRNNPAQNSDLGINGAYPHGIGAIPANAAYLDGYMAEVHFVDGTALDPTSFGEFDENGVWRPINVSGLTYGTNGFYLSFADNTSTTTLGYDDAGSNDWTLNNFSVTAGAGNDSLEDTPTNNFCTLTPLNAAVSTNLSDGNLRHTTGVANWNASSGSVAVSSGKWYWEVTIGATSANGTIIAISNQPRTFIGGAVEPTQYADGYGYYITNGQKRNNNAGSAYGATATNGDVIGVALDLDAGTLVFYKNNVTQGTAFSSLSGTFAPSIGIYDAGQYSDFNFGQRPFAYTPPTGYSALNTANLTASDIADPSDYFQARTYTGFTGLIGDETRITPGTKTVARSLRFNDDDTAYLSKTFGSAGTGAGRTATFSFWVKRGNLGTEQFLINWSGASADGLRFSSDKLYGYAGSGSWTYETTAVFRDPSAWYHVVFIVDSTQATAADRAQIWVNGVRQALSISGYTSMTLNADVNVLDNVVHAFGKQHSGVSYFDGYLAEFHAVDGQALDPTTFGETNADGIWVPKLVSGVSYGTNGFYLSFADNSSTTTLGYDDAGSNDWTLTNFSVAAGAGNDSLEDTPTNNWAVLSSIDKVSAGTQQNGNLTHHCSASDFQSVRSTIAMPTGLWYAEATVGGDWLGTFGIGLTTVAVTSFSSAFNNGYVILNNAAGTRVTRSNNVDTNSRTADAANDVWQCAYNADTGNLWLGRNNTWFGGGDPAAGTSPTYTVAAGLYAFIASGGNGSGQPMNLNFGQRAFTHTPPTGFSALCTSNLAAIADDDLWFKGEVPDLLWLKGRSGATHHKLVDTTRGAALNLSSSGTGAETGEATVLSINKYGMRLGDDADVNTAAATYALWAWKEGLTPGFEVVSYVGDNTSNRNISHSLGAAPSFAIIKDRTNTRNWYAYHRSLTSAAYYLTLNLTDAQSNVNSPFGTGNWSSTQFMVSNATNNGNAANANYIAYLFAEIEGFSKAGSYTGNGAADGPFVWCGFRPKFVMITDASAANIGWRIYDTAREVNNLSGGGLEAYSSAAEAFDTSVRGIDILSNGFKVRVSASGLNGSGVTFVFIAFAECPFSAPSTAR